MNHAKIYQAYPKLSEACKNYIKIHLSPSYWNDEEQLHSLHYVYETLTDEINGKETFLGITLNDIKVLDELIKEDIDYIIIN